MIVYALFGVFFFKGALENRCRTTPLPINGSWDLDPNVQYLCGSTECPIGLLFRLLIKKNI